MKEITEKDKAKIYDRIAERFDLESENDFITIGNNSELWSDFVDGKQIRLIDIDANLDPVFTYTNQDQIVKALRLLDGVEKGIVEKIILDVYNEEISNWVKQEEGRSDHQVQVIRSIRESVREISRIASHKINQELQRILE